jgi:plasmid stabilization system protein ParE
VKTGFHPAAEAELRAAIAYYEAHVGRLGEAFAIEVERAYSALMEMQGLGERVDPAHRRIPLRRFPYWIIYRSDPNDLTVVAVAHMRRKSGYWRWRK